MNYAEFQPGSRVRVEGNGEGTISWREDRASVARPNLDRYPMFTVKTDAGHTVVVTPDKLTLVLPDGPGVHAWVAPHSAASDLCAGMVMRRGSGDTCGLPKDHHVHGPQKREDLPPYKRGMLEAIQEEFQKRTERLAVPDYSGLPPHAWIPTLQPDHLGNVSEECGVPVVRDGDPEECGLPANHPVHLRHQIPADRIGGKLVGPPPDMFQKARGRVGQVGETAKAAQEEMETAKADAEQLADTGVIRVPIPKDFGVGSFVCLCRHPLQNVPGSHPRAKVVEIRKASSIEPWVLKDLKSESFIYANSKQFTPVDAYAYCPFDERGRLSRDDLNIVTGQLQTDGETIFWGFRIGDDVSVRGWGAGKIKSVDTVRKKPICVELARGTLVWTDLEHLSKIKYAVMPAPLTRDDLNIEPITGEVRNEIDRLRGLLDDRLKGTQSKIDKLSAKVDMITEQLANNNRISERAERKQQMILEILGVLEAKLGGPWLKDDERTIPGEIDRVEKKLDALITQLEGDGK